MSIFWTSNYIQNETNSDRNRALSVEQYINKIRPYLKDIINDVKNLTNEKFN